MSDLGRVLRLDARRTALLVAVPVLTLVGLAAAWPRLTPSVAYWDNSVVALINAVRFLGPVAAGLAAWTAVRERPLDFLRDLTARSPATGVLVDLLLLSASSLVSYGTITFVVVAVTLLRQETGHLHPLGVLAGAGALVLHVVAGYLAGRVVPRRATVALVVLVTGAWSWLRIPGMSWWSLLPPASLDRVCVYTTLRPAILAHQLAWTVGLTGALILGYVLWATRRRRIVLGLALSLGLAGAATDAIRLTGGEAVSPVTTRPICREWPLPVCVHPALRDALPSLAAAAIPLASRLHGTPGAFTRVEQRPGWAPATVAGGVATVHLDEELAPGFATRAVRQILDGLKTTRTCDPATGGYRSLVDAWLTGAEPPVIADPPAARAFASWTEDARRTWLRTHFLRYQSCGLRPSDFRAAALGESPPRTPDRAAQARRDRASAVRRGPAGGRRHTEGGRRHTSGGRPAQAAAGAAGLIQ